MNRFLFLIIGCWMATNAMAQADNRQEPDYLAEQQYRFARSFYQEKLKSSPVSARDLLGLGESLLGLQNADSANLVFRSILAREPQNAFALAGVGKAALLSNDRVSEIEYFDRARRAARTDPAIYCSIAQGCISLASKDTATAKSNIELGLLQDSRYAPLHMATGDLDLLQRKYGEAANAFERAIFFDPGSALAWTRSGYALTLTRSYEAAEKALLKSETIRPSQILLYRYRGDLFYLTEKYPEAEKAYQTFLSRAEPKPEDSERLATVFFFNGKYRESAALMATIPADGKEDPYRLRIRGYVAYETGDFENSLVYLKELFRLLKPEKLTRSDFIYHSRVLVKTGNDTTALSYLRKAAAMGPFSPKLQEEIAQLASRCGHHAEAALCYREMGEKGGDKVAASFLEGREYYLEAAHLKSVLDSVPRARQSTATVPRNRQSDRQKITLLCQKADSAFSVTLAANPGYAIGFLWKARTAVLSDPEAGSETARDAYEKALAILETGDKAANRKTIMECCRYLGTWYYNRYEKLYDADKKRAGEMRQKAIGYFTRLAELDPADARIREILSHLKN